MWDLKKKKKTHDGINQQLHFAAEVNKPLAEIAHRIKCNQLNYCI